MEQPKQKETYRNVYLGGSHTVPVTNKSIVIAGVKSIIFLIVVFVPIPSLPIRITLAIAWFALFIWMLVRIFRVDSKLVRSDQSDQSNI